MAKQLYDYWFVQFDFPNEDGKPYKSSGGAMVWNEKLKRRIPEGWNVMSINEICTSCRGVSYGKDDLLSDSNGVLVLRGNNIENNRIVYDSNVAFVPNDFVSEEQHIKEGDIIMTMSSGSKAHVGKCAMFHKDSEHTFGAFLSKFTPKKELRYMTFLFLTSEYFKSLITAFCNGTGINNLTNQTFDDVLLVLPDKNKTRMFESKVNNLFTMIGNNEENMRASRAPLACMSKRWTSSSLLASDSKCTWPLAYNSNTFTEGALERGRPPWQDGICPKLKGFGSPWTGRGLDAARHETHTLRDLALVAAHVGCGRRGPRASACKGSLASLVRERTRNEDH